MKKFRNIVLLILVLLIVFTSCKSGNTSTSTQSESINTEASENTEEHIVYIRTDGAERNVINYVRENEGDYLTPSFCAIYVVKIEKEYYFEVIGYGTYEYEGVGTVADFDNPITEPYYVQIITGDVYEASYFMQNVERGISILEAADLVAEEKDITNVEYIWFGAVEIVDERIQYVIECHAGLQGWYVDVFNGEITLKYSLLDEE